MYQKDCQSLLPHGRALDNFQNNNILKIVSVSIWRFTQLALSTMKADVHIHMFLEYNF